jgi:Ala-tRNA(Pro) deacylase
MSALLPRRRSQMDVPQFLTHEQVEFSLIPHPRTETTQHLAEQVHVSGDHVAKSVLLRSPPNFLLAVLPASYRIDLPKLRKQLGVRNLELANETEVSERFPEYEVGALPPFGSQFGVPSVVDRSLTDKEEIVFDAGSHTQAVRMPYADFERLEQPQVFEFACHA